MGLPFQAASMDHWHQLCKTDFRSILTGDEAEGSTRPSSSPGSGRGVAGELAFTLGAEALTACRAAMADGEAQVLEDKEHLLLDGARYGDLEDVQLALEQNAGVDCADDLGRTGK